MGAGPAGLVLGHLLARRGIESVVIEARDRDYVQQRVRAGVLEQGTVDLLVEAGVGDRLRREGLVHEGLDLRFGGRAHRIALSSLTGGRAITIYGQQEVVKDLTDARLSAGAPLFFEVDDVRMEEGRRFAAALPARLAPDPESPLDRPSGADERPVDVSRAVLRCIDLSKFVQRATHHSQVLSYGPNFLLPRTGRHPNHFSQASSMRSMRA